MVVALPVGRLGPPVQDLLRRAQVPGAELWREADRRLLWEADGWRFLLARPADVLTYVREGAAHVGITGKDVLLEDAGGVYELLDLGVGACRLVVAAPRGTDWEALLAGRGPGLRVATKYPRAAQAHFARRGVAPRIIRLAGSVELAPQAGLADAIVDLVATGRTLEANGLAEMELVAPVTARLIANQEAYRWRADEVEALRSRLADARGGVTVA
jgi:ATP phosphoribosyltransferase